MDKTLKSIYLRLDSTTQSLTKNAISQLLIKIIYASNGYMTEQQVIIEYENVIGKSKVDENVIKSCLVKLVEERSIILQRGQYHISTNKRRKIDTSYQESEERKRDIINDYFKPFFQMKKL